MANLSKTRIILTTSLYSIPGVEKPISMTELAVLAVSYTEQTGTGIETALEYALMGTDQHDQDEEGNDGYAVVLQQPKTGKLYWKFNNSFEKPDRYDYQIEKYERDMEYAD